MKLICGDFLKNKLPDNCIDLIVTSPPYNVGIDYGKHDDNASYEDYLAWSRKWLGEALRVLKPDGRMCVNLPLDTGKGEPRSVTADLTVLAKKIGFGYKTTIIWNEGHIAGKFYWGTYMSALSPNVIAPVETIVVLYKDRWKKSPTTHEATWGKSDITKAEFLNWTKGMWSFAGESRKLHPAPFPVEIPKRCIKLFSFVGDKVLDPFVGSGTTLLACKKLGREGIGYEIEERWCRVARERIGKQLIVRKW